MNSEADRSFGLKTVIAWCAGVAVACISGTYHFTDNTLKAELEQYKTSHQWQLPLLLEKLGDISKELQSQLKEKSEFDRLNKFEKQHATDFERLNKELMIANERLKACEGDTVILGYSQTVPLGEPGLVLGLKSTGMVSDSVNLNVGNKTLAIEIGNSDKFDSETTNYTFTYKGKHPDGRYEIIVVRKPLGVNG
ncbi:MAG: hypothetical protein WC836_12560 [Desulfobacula sp.]|jgi:hypothetical protein